MGQRCCSRSRTRKIQQEEEEEKTLSMPENIKDKDAIWLLRPRELVYLPKGTQILSIDGEQLVSGRDHVDEETRDGYLAYGLHLSQWSRGDLGRMLGIPAGERRRWWTVARRMKDAIIPHPDAGLVGNATV
jgi:hypothetical protein